ncbi:Aminodeoxychorismate/anthranilate synthase component 2 [bioreactor metagenome]|uniref:Aminodeoxychorismate/anthranilate synthase component 2 n=1 Tax=bioreactor metagenome TaxID=1076179 RepID=A0A644ZP52_9ZZZZ
MIFMLDNYDSFTYNLVQYLQMLGAEVVVRRNDEITVDEVLAMKPEAIVLSPGPGRPENAGILIDLIRASGKIPLLGVCLGHQAIGAAFGGAVIRAKRIMHGKTSVVTHDGQGLFTGLGKSFPAVRYHSLVIDEATLPECLTVTARSDDGEIMGVRYNRPDRLIEGVQYHPESILSTNGKRQLQNFLNLAADFNREQ